MDQLGTALGILIGLFLVSMVLLMLSGFFSLIQFCRGLWPFHAWGAWGAPYSGTQTRGTGHFGDIRSYPVVVQSRFCARCGAVDYQVKDVDVKLADLARTLAKENGR